MAPSSGRDQLENVGVLTLSAFLRQGFVGFELLFEALLAVFDQLRSDASDGRGSTRGARARNSVKQRSSRPTL